MLFVYVLLLKNYLWSCFHVFRYLHICKDQNNKKCNTNKIVNLFLRETGSPWEMLPFQGVTYISQTTIFNYQTCPTLSGSLFINHCDHVTITCSMIKRATHGNAWGNGGWIKQGLQWFIQQISDEKDKTFTPFTWPNSTCQTAFRFTVKIKL